MFGYQNANNYYRFSMDQESAYRRLVKVVNGVATRLAEDNVEYRRNQLYLVQVRFAPGWSEIWIDGVLLFHADDTSFLAGKVALYTWANAGAEFDDFVVEKPTILPPTPAAITVALTPVGTTLTASQTQQFTAVVSGSSNQQVTWSFVPAVGGISSNGLYTAPSTISTQQSVTVTATSAADPTKRASATVTLIPTVTVLVSPANSTLTASQKQQFIATVAGSSNDQVTWSLNPEEGRISKAGLYTAPNTVTTQQTIMVTATSVADPTKSAMATVSLNPTVALLISPGSITLKASQTQQFTATVSTLSSPQSQQPTATAAGGSNSQVIWSVNPTVGMISSDGVYTAPAEVNTQQTVTVTATSVSDPTKSVTATVTLSPTVAVSISPVGVTLTASQTQQFTATLTGSSDERITWLLSPPDVGGLSTNGTIALFNSPDIIDQKQNVEVIATSVADPTKWAKAVISLLPVVSVSVTPGYANVLPSRSQQITASVTGTTNRAVTWSLNPSVGAITDAGLYTAPSTITAEQVVEAKATSVENPTKSASAIVVIKDPGNMTITSPIAGATVTGTVIFAVDTGGLPSTASVEYSIGGKVLGIVDEPPFSLTYNTALLLDGSLVLQAKARNAFGNLLAEVELPFRVSNRGVTMTVNSPSINGTLSGKVTMSVTSSEPEYCPTFWFGSLDGEDSAYADTGSDPSQQTQTRNLTFDTTRFFNGKHELHITMHSLELLGDRRVPKDYRGMFTRMVNIDNGHTLMEVVSNYLHLYLAPGQRVTLTCKAVFTDRTVGACNSPSFSSDNASVASVDSSGVVTATGEGFAQITMAAGSKTTKAYVWVRPDQHIPHFAGNGQILRQYAPGQSLFVVAPFVLEPAEVRDRAPGLLGEVLRASVNTLQQGFYPNPRNLSKTWESWKSEYDSQFVPNWAYAVSNGLHLLPSGDDVARNIGGEGWWTLNWPYGKQAVQYAMQKLAESGTAVAVDVVDEVSMMWGGTPRPPGKVGAPNSFTSITCSGEVCIVLWPSNPVNSSRFPFGTSFAMTGSTNPNLNTPDGQMFKATNITADSFEFKPAGPLTGTFTADNDPNLEFLWWAGPAGGCPTTPCSPAVPNTAITTISDWLRSAPASVPISWPSLGVSPPVVHGNWMGKGGVSDYASHYWDTFRGRKTYPWGWGTEEANTWMRTAFYARQGYMDLSKPQLMLTSLMGPMYRKGTPGSYFNPPGDLLLTPGTTPQAIVSNMATAAALGNAGVRLYMYDRTSEKAGRAQAALGADLQTGANPFDTNVGHWQAMGYAASLLTKVLEPYFLGVALNSPAYGRNIVTAARQGPDAAMLLIVNGSDAQTTITVDFTPYKSGTAITRYRLSPDAIATDVLPDGDGEAVTLADGESVVYLFPFVPSTAFTKAVTIAPPEHPGSKAVLNYSYVYQSMLRKRIQGIPCTTDCTLNLDLRLGDVYYQFTYLNENDEVVGKSPSALYSPKP